MTQYSLCLDLLRRAERPDGWRPDEPPDLRDAREVAIDFETTGLRWWAGDVLVGLAVSWDGGRESRYLPFGHRGGGNLDESRVKDWARDQLRGRHLFALNMPFDAHNGHGWGLDFEAMGCRLGDVGHRAALLDDTRREFNLESIARDYVGEGKVEGLDKSKIASYGAWEVTPYGRQDASLVLRILEQMKPLLSAQSLGEVVALEDDVIFPAVEMERNAAPVDLEKLARWVRESEAESLLADLRVTKAAGRAVNPDSPEDMARLFRDRRIEAEKFTPTGRPSFDAEVVEAAAEADEVVALVLRAARLRDLRSKYLVPYAQSVGPDGLLRFSLHQLKGDEYGTISGRFSCSKLEKGRTGFNVQQVMALDKQLRLYCWQCAARSRVAMSDSARVALHYAEHGQAYIVRELHVPAKGKRFAAADAKQIEYRIFAGLTRSRRLLEVYERDPEADFHASVAEMVRPFRADLDRKRVKNLNFAKLYGAGLKKIAGMLGMSEEEAKPFIASYDEAFPEARTLLKLAIETAERRGYVRTATGRRARFPTRVRAHSALNRVIQGSAADEFKKKAVLLYRERRRLGLTMRMPVHDEFTCDVPDDGAAAELKRTLETELIDFGVPILWDVKTGANWAECK